MAFQSGNPSAVEEIVQEFYSDMKRDLNIADIVDLMFDKGFIDHQFKRNLERETQQHGSTKANQVLLDYLIEKGTLETLERFCDILEESSKRLPRHKEWADKLRQQLSKYSEGPMSPGYSGRTGSMSTTSSTTEMEREPIPSLSEDVLTATSSYSSTVQQRSLKKYKIVSEMSKDIQSSSCHLMPSLISSPVTHSEQTKALSTMDDRSKKIKEIVDKYRNGEGELLLPSNPDLEDELDEIMGALRGQLSSADPSTISRLHTMVQRKYRRYIHGVRQAPLPDIPNTPEGLYEFISEKPTPYEIFFVLEAAEQLRERTLRNKCKRYKEKLAKCLLDTLTTCKKRKVKLPSLQDHPHMALVISKEQVLLALVLHFKEYYSKYLGLDEALFTGFKKGCTTVFFTISEDDAKSMADKVPPIIADLHSEFKATHLVVFGHFSYDFIQFTRETIIQFIQSVRDLVHHRDTGTATFRKAADDLDEAHRALTAARNVGIGTVILAGTLGAVLVLGGVTAPAGVAMIGAAGGLVGAGATVRDYVQRRETLKRANEWIGKNQQLCKTVIRKCKKFEDVCKKKETYHRELIRAAIKDHPNREELNRTLYQTLLLAVHHVRTWEIVLEQSARVIATRFVSGSPLVEPHGHDESMCFYDSLGPPTPDIRTRIRNLVTQSSVFTVIDLPLVLETARDIGRTSEGTDLSRRLRSAANSFAVETDELRKLADIDL